MTRTLALLAAGLAAVKAQGTDSLPQCGQTCVNNMLEIAVSQFGCDANDLASCACCNVDFGFGIRDCSRQVCGDGSQDYSSVISYGSAYCASAVTSCPSGTQASSVLATATNGGGSGSGTASGSMSMSSPAMTSGPLAGAVGAISTVSGSSNAYVVNGQTITPGGDSYGDDDTEYSALPSGGGVVVSNGDSQTTYMPGMGMGGAGGAGASNSSSGMMTMTSGGSGSGMGGAGAVVSAVSGSPNQYVVDGQTISAGGDGTDEDGTSYTALPSGSGIRVVASGQTATVNPTASASGGNGGAGGAVTVDNLETLTGGTQSASGSASASGSGGNGGGAGGSNNNGNNNNNGNDSGDSASSSSESGNFAPVQTAAPALIGAAAMAILAL